MRRRDFWAGAGIAAAAAVGAGAQPVENVRRVVVIVPGGANDARYQSWIGTFRKALGTDKAGERNVRVDVRFATDGASQIRKHVAELVAQKPDVIVAHGASTIRPLMQATRSIPIVFPIVADPVGGGFVRNLTRPGGNVTGFMTTEYGSAGKWLELLKELLQA
jgi:putative ABC transport system substrate-binding protein